MTARRVLLSVALLLWLAAPAQAQVDRVLDAVECTQADVTGQGTVSIEITGTWAGTITWYVSGTGGTRVPIDLFTPGAGGTEVNSTTANGAWAGSVAGWRVFMACMTTYTSGAATVTIGTASSGGGGGAGGGATETTLSSMAADIASIADNLAPESVHGNTVIATGAGILGEAKDVDGSALPNVVTEGQAIRIATTLSGGLLTFLTNEAGTQSPIFADDAAFTPATSNLLAIGFQADETTPDSVDEGDVGTPRMTLARAIYTTPVPHTIGGLDIYRSLDLDEGAGEVIKASPGQLYSLWVTNTATATRWIKIYNATSCTMGTGTPVITVGIAGNASDDVVAVLTGGGYGIAFATGICFGATTGVADADTGAPGANDVIANAYYK